MAKEVSPAFPDPAVQHGLQGLGVDEEKARGFHQGWEVSALPEKAVYMTATESHLTIVH